MKDFILVARVFENSENYAAIAEKYERSLLRFLLRISDISREEAENLLQNNFSKLRESHELREKMRAIYEKLGIDFGGYRGGGKIGRFFYSQQLKNSRLKSSKKRLFDFPEKYFWKDRKN